MLIIGVDCATDDSNVGLALAEYEAGHLSLQEATRPTRADPPEAIVSAWLRSTSRPALLALDAPLGWPRQMGGVLAQHQAGEPIGVHPNELFRRETDRFIKRMLGKTPLDVGADRIARTAHAALTLLERVRTHLGLAIPLAWGLPLDSTSAIEVYPAATLIAHSLRSTGYKQATNRTARRELVGAMGGLLDIGSHEEALIDNADVLDAAVCALAGKDFLDCLATPPEDLDLARWEGWIWAASPRAL